MKNIGIDYNLTPKELELAQQLVPELYNAETIGPMPVIRDWEADFENDMKRKFGFIVSAKPFKKNPKNDKSSEPSAKGTKEMYGIHSPLFGTDWLDDNAFADRYSCDCGKMIGKVFKGRRCPDCGTKVEYVDVNLRIFAYIVINDARFSIIQPLLYKELDVFFGKANKTSILSQIIGFDKDMKLDGFYGGTTDVDLSKNPFAGIGMIEFHERFDEIMDFFFRKKKNRKAQYDLIMENKDKLFVTKIPVYSAVLREVFFSNEKFSYRKVDRCYNALYGNVCRINDEHEIKTSNIAKLNNTLFRAQNNLNQVFDSVFTSIHENEGLIRRSILGGRINNAARCVIVPDASLRSYEVRLPLNISGLMR